MILKQLDPFALKGHHLGRKYARIFVLGHYLFLEAHSFPPATLSENCSLLGIDNQITGLYQQNPSIFADRSFCINKDIIIIIIYKCPRTNIREYFSRQMEAIIYLFIVAFL